MRTDQLIDELAADSGPVPRAGTRLAVAVAAGTALAVGGLSAVFGSPLDPIAQRGIGASGMKVLYPAIVAFFGTAAVLAAGRPGDRPIRWLIPVLMAVAVVLVAAILQYSAAAPGHRQHLWFGSTLTRCVSSVVLASVPTFIVLTVAFRALAPTNISLAGFLIGLTSGGAAAAAYALFCPEVSRLFLISAYTPAMLIPALAGAAIAPLTLRW